MKMNDKYLSFLIEKWKFDITVKGSGFMLPYEKAFAFAEDLAKGDEIIIGCDGWCYVDKSKNWIVQVLEVGLTLEEFVSWDKMTPERNLEILQTFLSSLPKNIDLISIQPNDPEVTTKIIEGVSH